MAELQADNKGHILTPRRFLGATASSIASTGGADD
jgi:hypothetical protein